MKTSGDDSTTRWIVSVNGIDQMTFAHKRMALTVVAIAAKRVEGEGEVVFDIRRADQEGAASFHE